MSAAAGFQSCFLNAEERLQHRGDHDQKDAAAKPCGGCAYLYSARRESGHALYLALGLQRYQCAVSVR